MKQLLKLFVLAPIILSGCMFNESNESEKESVVIDVDHDYSEISDYELTWEAIFDVDEPNYYVYIFSLTCSHCEEIKNYMIEKALERGDIYFVKGSSKDQITNDPNKLKYAENPGDIWILGYPSLLKIVDKKVVKNLAGTNQILSEIK